MSAIEKRPAGEQEIFSAPETNPVQSHLVHAVTQRAIEYTRQLGHQMVDITHIIGGMVELGALPSKLKPQDIRGMVGRIGKPFAGSRVSPDPIFTTRAEEALLIATQKAQEEEASQISIDHLYRGIDEVDKKQREKNTREGKSNLKGEDIPPYDIYKSLGVGRLLEGTRYTNETMVGVARFFSDEDVYMKDKIAAARQIRRVVLQKKKIIKKKIK